MKLEAYVVGPVQTNCYFVINEQTNDCVVIDPGASGSQLGAMLVKKGYKPQAILLTHGHFDHMSGVRELQKYFENKNTDSADNAGSDQTDAAVSDDGMTDSDIIINNNKYSAADFRHSLPAFINEKEADTLKDPDINLSDGLMGDPMTYEDLIDRYLDDNDELEIAGFKIKVLFTPGHTPGGESFYFPDEKLLFPGDTLFHGSVGRTDFAGGSMSDLVRGLREKLLTLPDDTKVYPGHNDSTTIAEEKQYNPYA